jgi:hypothetical protein
MDISHQAILVFVLRVSESAMMAAINCRMMEISSAILMGMGKGFMQI